MEVDVPHQGKDMDKPRKQALLLDNTSHDSRLSLRSLRTAPNAGTPAPRSHILRLRPSSLILYDEVRLAILVIVQE